jgi:RNA polymerase sigma-70 factor (ECF subfamily)
MNDQSGYIQFLAEARTGDRVGMGRLAELVWERLYPFVFRMTLDRDATEDVIQETLLTMLRRLDSLRDCQRFWPWIYRIAWNRVQDRLRDRRLQSLHEAALLRRAHGEGRLSADHDPLDAQVRAETLERVSAAVARLNHRQRDILQLRCYEDLPYTEIAARTRTSPDKVRVRFHRAKKSLKTRLACCAISS